MRLAAALLLLVIVGCSSTHVHDSRLEGTWVNPEYGATVSYTNGLRVQMIPALIHPHLTNMPVFKAQAGQQASQSAVTNAAETAGSAISDSTSAGRNMITLRDRYRILGRGNDFLDLKYPDHPFRNEHSEYVDESDQTVKVLSTVSSDQRIHFSPNGKAYWVGADADHGMWFYKSEE